MSVVNGVAVVRWQRYGKDRLYANDDTTGVRLGWMDLQTGDRVERETRPGDVMAALDAWLQQGGHPGHVPGGEPVSRPGSAVEARPNIDVLPQQPTASPAPVPAPPRDVADLAANRPSAAAREQAILRRQQAPVRS